MVEYLSHYCGTRVFLPFLTSKKLWLTSLSQSNDSMEGKWMRQHWINRVGGNDAKAHAEKRGMGSVLDVATHEKVALGTCFSEKDDLLSQWRGYADNGSGYSLTFHKDELEKIPEVTRAREPYKTDVPVGIEAPQRIPIHRQPVPTSGPVSAKSPPPFLARGSVSVRRVGC